MGVAIPSGLVDATAGGKPRVRGGAKPCLAVSGWPPGGPHRSRRPHPLRHSASRATAPGGLDARDDDRRDRSRRGAKAQDREAHERRSRGRAGGPPEGRADPRAVQRAAPRSAGGLFRRVPGLRRRHRLSVRDGSREARGEGGRRRGFFRVRGRLHRPTTRRKRASSPTTSGRSCAWRSRTSPRVRWPACRP